MHIKTKRKLFICQPHCRVVHGCALPLLQSRFNSMANTLPYDVPGVSNLLVSLGHTGRRVVLGHALNTQTLTKNDEKKIGFK